MSLAIKCTKLLNPSVDNACKLGGYYACRGFITVEEHSKIKWYKPARVPHRDPKQTGDLGLNVPVKPTDTILYYQNSKELEDANDIVKRMFTAEFRGAREFRNLKREHVINLVKRHVCDRGSAEVKIAAMTSEIHDLQEYMKVHPLNKKTRVFLDELIDKRKKYLKFLRIWDYRRFEWVLDKLNLIYKGPPERFGHVSRKDCIRKLTQIHCDEIIQKRLDAYKAELQGQQRQFYAEKAEKLASIMRDEKEYGLPPTVTEEQVEAARKKAEELLNENKV